MAKKRTRILKPFTTKHGEVKVGDMVAYLTVSTKNARMSVGKYLGYIENDRGEKRVQIEEPFTRAHWVYKDTGKRWDYKESWTTAQSKLERVTEEIMGVCTLQLNRILPLKVQNEAT